MSFNSRCNNDDSAISLMLNFSKFLKHDIGHESIILGMFQSLKR